jgi:hypothetical protein
VEKRIMIIARLCTSPEASTHIGNANAEFLAVGPVE